MHRESHSCISYRKPLLTGSVLSGGPERTVVDEDEDDSDSSGAKAVSTILVGEGQSKQSNLPPYPAKDAYDHFPMDVQSSVSWGLDAI